MTRRRRNVLIVAGAALCVGAAYVSTNYVLSPAVSDQGGGLADSSNFEIRGSVGGPVIGTASSANYSVEAGGITVVESRAAAPSPPAGGDGGCAPGAGSPGMVAPLVLALTLAHRRRRRLG